MGIMGSAKPLASLSSTLLARKGQARPAMRPQGFNPAPSAAALEDLGWNDMGGQDGTDATGDAGGQAAAPESLPPEFLPPESLPEPLPPVLEEREHLARQVEATVEPASGSNEAVAEPDPAPVAVSPRKAARIARNSAALTTGGKTAAFTLRLDADRHLRLRLASAVANRSAQALVAGALDQFLQSMPEVEALAARLPTVKVRS